MIEGEDILDLIENAGGYTKMLFLKELSTQI